MSYEEVQKVWMNGGLVDFADAKIHAFSHVFHYGSAMFEGIRVYKTRNGPAAFRLEDHIERLYHSCKVYRMEIPYTHSQFQDAIFETIRVNGFDACYIRPVIYRGLGALGVNPFKSPVDVIIAVWKWGQYLGEDAVTKGVDVCVSSWNRMAPNTFPAMAKATG
ncbi:MAG TPA: aminotransferase class IV, partial [Thermoanaerobaculia bacterium]|nr:aminotransferase class IV [Thermoanaerobaculia bacterium]